MEVDATLPLCKTFVSVVFPGEDINENLESCSHNVSIGEGLVRSGSAVLPNVTGSLNMRFPGHFWVETSCKRYKPITGDSVVALVEDKAGDFYTLNIFSSHSCVLNRLAFDGATKRNKPELNRGDIVFGRIKLANSDCDTEVTCMADAGPKKDWSTGEAIFGELRDGLIVRIPLDYARRLLQPSNVLFDALSKHFCFEVAIGMNGAVWLRATGNNIVDTIVIRNAVLSAESMDAAQTLSLVEELVKLSKSVSRPYLQVA